MKNYSAKFEFLHTSYYCVLKLFYNIKGKYTAESLSKQALLTNILISLKFTHN